MLYIFRRKKQTETKRHHRKDHDQNGLGHPNSSARMERKMLYTAN